jgi:methyl-accepting chemotaxis protein
VVVGSAALFLASVGLYFFFLGPIAKIRSETATLTSLSRAVSRLQIEANKLATAPLGAQAAEYHKAHDAFLAAGSAVKDLVYLPRVSPEVASTVKAVGGLGERLAVKFDGLDESLSDIEAHSDPAAPFASSTILQIVLASTRSGLPNTRELGVSTGNLVVRLQSLNDTIDAALEIAEQKNAQIDDVVTKLEFAGSSAGLIGILLAVAGGVTVSIVVARGVTRALSALGKTVSQVGTGDLRVRTATRRRDEIGGLGRDVDGFLNVLTGTFRRIQMASAENLQVKDQLVLSVSSATSSAVQIEANSTSILAQLKRADVRIQASETDLQGVAQLIGAFRTRLDTQGQGVTNATRSVAELTRGITQTTELSDENRQAVQTLLAESDRGREVFERSFAKVAEITASVSAIQGMVSAIADIASQTNILALNAAIEAAHAGEAGKGFAVVADEISKLAAASSSSSSQIAATIGEVITKIREAGATREEALSAFDAIGAHIGTVSTRSRNIDSVAVKMNQGTHQIQEVMDTLLVDAEDTLKEAQRISSVVASLGETLGDVGRISHEVVSSIGEITAGLAEISRMVGQVHDQADRLGRTGISLDEAVNAFKTDESSETPLETSIGQ